MLGKDIALDKAELLSVLMEGMLYGFSLLMFCGMIWALLTRKPTHRVNHRVLVVACLLLVFSTAHFVINIIRMMFGFVLYRESFPGGTVGYFSDVSQWTWVYMNYVFTAQTLLGDSVVLYRCYAVWRSKLVMVVPIMLWCAVGVTGVESPLTGTQGHQDGVFSGRLAQWITSYWVSALGTNLLTTVLLVCRIWHVDHKRARMHGPGKLRPRPLLYIIIDAGLIYSLTLVVALTCFLCQSNFQYMLLPMVTPIISITFYMVIIRLELANRATQAAVPRASMEVALHDRRQGMEVQLTTLAESKIEDSRSSFAGPVGRAHSGEDKPEVGIAV